MSSRAYAVLIDCAAALGAVLVLLPHVLYLLTAWRTRRDKLFNYLRACNKTPYRFAHCG
jgi:hypothetical protein